MLEKKDIEKIMSKELIDIFKKYKGVLAGGTIRSLYCQKLDYKEEDYSEVDKISDFDIYFKENINYQDLKSELSKLGYTNTYETINAITLTDDEKKLIPIQLIVLDFTIGQPETIINSIDFSVCAGAYDFEEEKFYLDKNFEEDNQKRKLRYNTKGRFPLAGLIRVNKYVEKKKYWISNLELLKIGLSIHNLKIDSYKDLKEQLNGIDTLLLEPLTRNLIEGEDYEMDKFMDEMEEYLERTLNKEKDAVLPF